ncbi:DUF5050 domain-containing protein [Paenibacillus sp. LMG 31460]|uniref:DUF5050 domain-containing protein n=1 Tax=Paenibacillus germinis TaxID=2654979 RepID=A0ABX1Z777_9BACL|nr:DUF5050 domain-containing protein [Paenibacillus germinis]NOU89022.1 DUF5050 domain-containing protein [Paenibacillus germinis]
MRVKYLSICVILSIILLSGNGSYVSANSSQTNAKIIVDGKELSFEVPPVNADGTVMVPMRPIFEALQAKVSWNEIRRTATAVKETTTIKVTTNSTSAYINEREVILGVRPYVNEGNTMVPVRFISEAFGATVAWNEFTQTVTIKTSALPSTVDPIDTSVGFSEESMTNSNFVNGGKFTAQDDSIYFVGYITRTTRGIFKKNMNSSESPVMITSSSSISSLNVANDWVYYTDFSVYRPLETMGRLYKIKTDGIDRVLLSEKSANNALVHGEWVYFTTFKKFNADAQLYRVKVDGSSEELISDHFQNTFSIVGDQIYYSLFDNSKKSNTIYSMGLDSTGITQLVSYATYNPESIFIIENGLLYFQELSKSKYTFNKIQLDGSQKTAVFVGGSGDHFNVTRGWVYYPNPYDNGSVYRVRTDGSDNTKITEQKGYNVYFSKYNIIYYLDILFGELKVRNAWFNSGFNSSELKNIYEFLEK